MYLSQVRYALQCVASSPFGFYRWLSIHEWLQCGPLDQRTHHERCDGYFPQHAFLGWLIAELMQRSPGQSHASDADPGSHSTAVSPHA